MTEPLARPDPKNPLARTRQPLLPPAARSRAAHGLTRGAAEGRFVLQCCTECGRYDYPARDACANCLCPNPPFADAANGGVLVAETLIRVSGEPYFREQLPWRQGIVLADCGPTIVASLHRDCIEGARVSLSIQLDRAGQPVMFAAPVKEVANMQDDPTWRQLTADPKYRRVLITDGREAVGQALATSLLRAGAARVFLGIAESWKPFEAEDRLRSVEGIEIVSLDPTDAHSVARLAADIGGKVDILVNTVEHIRPSGLLDTGGVGRLAESMDRMVLATMRLANAFAPAMISRGADGSNSAAAWVNILSAYGLANLPEYGALSVSSAACISLSHWLRMELRRGGVRLLNAFAGPLDTEWYQLSPPPKVAPSQLAEAVVSGLRRGLEEVYVGDIATDIRDRLAANPKALEREIAP